MGGKNKQRTKGNVRPSSSGRAAEVLAREGGVIPGFVGFDTTANSELSYVPAVHGAEEIDNLVDADFRLVLRKLSKRDVVTRLKAVQDFASMCQERDAEEVKGVLPYWPRIYCKISVDHDRRIREATQQAFEQLVLKVRRNLAPFLKSLMGHWILSQCDTYTPAASAACQAFQAAFSPTKQPEALSFCKDEILTVLQDILLKETADTLSDSQSVTKEERDAKYLRMLTSSLLGVKRLLSLLQQSDRTALEQRLADLLSSGRFWKYSKHKTPQVRGAFFTMVCALCEFTPGLVQAEAARLCPAVLLSIDDTDPAVLPPVWEAVLRVVSTIPDCWTHVNAKKGFLPKLWALLNEGGAGMARALHPNLMPLLSKLPQEVTDPPLDFNTTFFTSLIQGLSSERASTSPSESAVIVTSIVECFRYCIAHHIEEEEGQRKIRTMLITQQLLPLLEKALGSSSLQNGPLFLLITEMLVSWENKAGLDGGEGAKDNAVFKELLSDFWDGLGLLFVSHGDDKDADPKVLEGVATMLQVMRHPDKVKRNQIQKKRSVRITLPKQESSEGSAAEGNVVKKAAQTEATLASEAAFGSPKTHHFEDVVCQLAQLCLVHVNEGKSERHLVFLSLLLRSFHTPRVFSSLVEVDGEKAKDEQQAEMNKKNPAMQFLLEQVVVWLSEKGREDTEHLVEMLFSSLCCCSSLETTRILNHVTTMEFHWRIILQIIKRACVDPEALKSCSEWLRGSVLGQRLLDLTEELCRVEGSAPTPASSKCQHSWALISLVLSQHHNGEALIGEVYLEKIIEKLHATLSETKSLSDAGNLEPLISFICDVASTFFSSVQDCLLLLSAEELLLTVFQLTAVTQTHSRLSDSLLAKLTRVCVAGVQSLVRHSDHQVKEGGFLHKSATWVKNQVLTLPLDIKSLQVLTQAVQTIVETIASVSDEESPLLVSFFTHLTPRQGEWTRIRQALPPQWVKMPLLSSRYRGLCEQSSVDVWKSQASARLPAHLCACALLGKVARLAAFRPCEQKTAENIPHLQILETTVSELLFALQWCEEVEHSSSAVASFHSLLADWGLSDGLHSLVPLRDLLETLYTRSLEDGGLWSLTLGNYISTNKLAATHSSTIRGLYGRADSLLPVSESKLSTLQLLCPAMTRQDRENLVALATAGLLNWEENADVYGNLAVLMCCLEADTQVEEEVALAVLATMMEWRNRKEDWFLFGSNLSSTPLDQLNLVVEMMRFLSWLVTHQPTVLGGSHWDFLLCSMMAWLEVASDNVGSLWNPWAQLFVCQNAALIVNLNRFFSSPPPGVAEKLPSELTAEWSDFFLEGIYNLMLPLPISITDAFTEPDEPAFPLAVLQSVGAALTYVPVQQLTNNRLPPRFSAEQSSNLPEPLQTLLNTFCPLLLFKARPLQITVYRLLEKVMPQLPECDTDGNKPDDDKDEPCLSPPAALMAVLSTCEELCESILAAVQVGEFAVVQPLSVEYSCILGYLLAWKLLLTFFKSAPAHLRVHYAQFIKRSCALSKLLLHLFKLMPENPTCPGQGPELREPKTFFTESISLAVDKSESVEWELPHLACSVYYNTVQDLPAMVRLWWNSQEKRVSAAVEKFTTKYVSPVLSAQEISSVHSSPQIFENMTVKARSAAREVIATYSVDDIFIELVIQLPQNCPLGSISVESGRRVGVAVQQWRNWMLQLSTYLTHQNGSIMEGLALWKNNVDKRFEGIEDCMICFSVIHGSNYSLPKKGCRTCKKKFHSACLYKWFTSSNKSTCPLCRETFF